MPQVEPAGASAEDEGSRHRAAAVNEEQYLFISYSRLDLPVAESIALHLILTGQAIWLDLFCLIPGLDWKLSIANGAKQAAGMIVVVSPNSLASRNVADEVQQAIHAGKAIILAVSEAAALRFEHLPDLDLEAAALAIVDFRGDFDPAVERLLKAWRSGEAVRDRPPVSRWIPLRVPAAVAQIAVASCLFMALEAWIWISWLRAGGFSWQVWAARLNLFALGGMMIWQAGATIAFLRRRLVREDFATQWLVLLLSVAYAVFWQRAHVMASARDWFVLAIAGGLTTFAYYRMFWSPDVFRWKRSDSPWTVPARKRQVNLLNERINEARKRAKRFTDPRPYIYSLTYSATDESIARLVRRALSRPANMFEAGRNAPPESPFPPVYLNFLIVTNRLSKEEWDTFERLPDAGKLYLLATPTRIPADVGANSGKLQWVDLRSLVPHQVSFLLMYLRGFQPARLRYATYYMPAQPYTLKGPNGLAMLAQAINFIAACTVATSICAFWSGMAENRVSWPLIGALPIGAWQFSLVHTLYQRTRTIGQFAGELLMTLVLCQMLGVYQFLLNTASVQDAFSTAIPFFLDRKYWIAAAGLYGFAIASSFALLVNRWFPKTGCWRPTPSSPSTVAIVRRQLPYALIALGLAFYMIVNASQ